MATFEGEIIKLWEPDTDGTGSGTSLGSTRFEVNKPVRNRARVASSGTDGVDGSPISDRICRLGIPSTNYEMRYVVRVRRRTPRKSARIDIASVLSRRPTGPSGSQSGKRCLGRLTWTRTRVHGVDDDEHSVVLSLPLTECYLIFSITLRTANNVRLIPIRRRFVIDRGDRPSVNYRNMVVNNLVRKSAIRFDLIKTTERTGGRRIIRL